MSIDPARVTAVIPAFNEAEAVAAVVRGLLARGIGRVRVVDNGSTDATAAVARAAGAEVVAEPRRGYGQACFTGAADLDAEWILFCDADGSDDLDSIPRLLAAAADHDLVLGDRRATPAGRAAMTPVQNFGNGLATLLLRGMFGARFRDLGPMRLIRRSAYEALAMRDRGFGWTVEMQARAAQLGLRWVELPVPYHRRAAGASKISGTLGGSFRAGTIILATLGRFALEVGQRPLALVAAALVMLGAGLMAPLGDFRTGTVPQFLAAAAVMALGFFLSWGVRGLTPWLFFGVAVGARLLLLPMVPGTDVWRYIWEGLVQNVGFNPYLLAPSSPALAALRPEWWGQINHPGIPAIYPPLAQLVFSVMAAVSPTLLFFKLVFVAADLAVAFLLWRRYRAGALLWAWNPLVLYSFAGGAHYDSLFILPMVAGWLALERGLRVGAIGLGLSLAIKYASAPLAGWLVWDALRRRCWGGAAGFALLVALPLALALAAFWIPWGVHALAPVSFGQYARSAEFLPRLVGVFAEWTTRANSVFVWPALALLLWRMVAAKSFRAFAEEAFLITFACSPAVHAWYFTWALPFAVASRNLGLRLVGISAFVYFLLEYRQALGPAPWRQTWTEMLLMWTPLLAGFAWSRWQARAATSPGHPRPPTPVPASAP